MPGLPRLRICVSELHPDGGSTASLPALNNTPVARLHLSARDVSATACRRSILLLIYTSLPPLSASVAYHTIANWCCAFLCCGRCLLLLLLGRGRFERWLSFPLPSTSTSPPHTRTNFIVRIPAPGAHQLRWCGLAFRQERRWTTTTLSVASYLSFHLYRPFTSNHLLPHPRHVEPRRQEGLEGKKCASGLLVDHSAPSSTAAFILACLSTATIVRLAGFR